MTLPREDEYNQAVQNPANAFSDFDLKNCKVEITSLGLPKPYSGGFTTTYKFFNANNSWAVRCFTRDVPDLKKRYQAIHSFISNKKSGYFIDTIYLPVGMKVSSRLLPIIKMKWVEGELLNVYLSKNLNNLLNIKKLIVEFENLVNEMDKMGIAHGDLQCGNIIVKNDKLYLIDYDGMFLPDLAFLQANEIGHPNFQHPKRCSLHYNNTIDRFSAIVIYLGIKAISINPGLWSKYDNGENILFTKTDFVNPSQSTLFRDLLSIKEIKPLAERFYGVCHLNFENIPKLTDFIGGNFYYRIPEQPKVNPTRKINTANNLVNEASVLNKLYSNWPPPVSAPAAHQQVKPNVWDYSIFIILLVVVFTFLFIEAYQQDRFSRDNPGTEAYSDDIKTEVGQQSDTGENNIDSSKYVDEHEFLSWLTDKRLLKRRPLVTDLQFRSLFPQDLTGIKRTQYYQTLDTANNYLEIPDGYAEFKKNDTICISVYIFAFNFYDNWHEMYVSWFDSTDEYRPIHRFSKFSGINMIETRLEYRKPDCALNNRISYYAGEGLFVIISGKGIDMESLKEISRKLAIKTKLSLF